MDWLTFRARVREQLSDDENERVSEDHLFACYLWDWTIEETARAVRQTGHYCKKIA